MHHDDDPEAAIVTFAKHSEANAAYRSTEAVLNNRFIKVFWHNAGASATHGGVPKDRGIGGGMSVRNPNKFLSNTAAQAAIVSKHIEADRIPGPALGSSDGEATSPTSTSPDSSTQLAAVPAKPPRPTAAEIRQQKIDVSQPLHGIYRESWSNNNSSVCHYMLLFYLFVYFRGS